MKQSMQKLQTENSKLKNQLAVSQQFKNRENRVRDETQVNQIPEPIETLQEEKKLVHENSSHSHELHHNQISNELGGEKDAGTPQETRLHSNESPTKQGSEKHSVTTIRNTEPDSQEVKAEQADKMESIQQNVVDEHPTDAFQDHALHNSELESSSNSDHMKLNKRLIQLQKNITALKRRLQQESTEKQSLKHLFLGDQDVGRLKSVQRNFLKEINDCSQALNLENSILSRSSNKTSATSDCTEDNESDISDFSVNHQEFLDVFSKDHQLGLTGDIIAATQLMAQLRRENQNMKQELKSRPQVLNLFFFLDSNLVDMK